MNKKAAAGKVIPGILLSGALAAGAVLLIQLLSLERIGASVAALFLGMLITSLRKPGELFAPGIRFTSKRILKLAMILLGASLNMGAILSVGRMTLMVLLFTLTVSFGGGYLLGKALKMDWKTAALISSGTGICGGSAIAAVAPVIDARDSDIAYALSTIFFFDMLLVLLVPILGRALALPDMTFGLWAGTAIHDTSSVVAAGYAFSERAGDFAAMVKLTRTLFLIPVVVSFSLIGMRKNAASEHRGADWMRLFPWFIVGFLAMSILRSLGWIPIELAQNLRTISRFLFVAALAAVGLGTNLRELRSSGGKAILLGFLLSSILLIVSLTAAYLLGSPQ